VGGDVDFVTDRALVATLLVDIERSTAVDRIAFGFADIKDLLFRDRLLASYVEMINEVFDGIDIIEAIRGRAFQSFAGTADQ
jgi:hypothetical protein